MKIETQEKCHDRAHIVKILLGLEFQSNHLHPPFLPPIPTRMKDGIFIVFSLEEISGIFSTSLENFFCGLSGQESIYLWRLCLITQKIQKSWLRRIFFPPDFAGEHRGNRNFMQLKEKGFICLCQFLISSLQKYLCPKACLS